MSIIIAKDFMDLVRFSINDWLKNFATNLKAFHSTQQNRNL